MRFAALGMAGLMFAVGVLSNLVTVYLPLLLLGQPSAIALAMFTAVGLLIAVHRGRVTRLAFLMVGGVSFWLIISLPVSPDTPGLGRHLGNSVAVWLLCVASIVVVEAARHVNIGLAFRYLFLVTMPFLFGTAIWASGVAVPYGTFLDDINRNYLIFHYALAIGPYAVISRRDGMAAGATGLLGVALLFWIAARIGSVTGSGVAILLLASSIMQLSRYASVSLGALGVLVAVVGFGVRSFELPAFERIAGLQRDAYLVLVAGRALGTSSGSERAYMLNVGVDLVRSDPVGGVGLGNTLLYWSRVRSQDIDAPGTHLHNQYLEIAASLGVASAILYIVAVLWGIIRGWRLRDTDRGWIGFHVLTMVALIGLTNTTYRSATFTLFTIMAWYWVFSPAAGRARWRRDGEAGVGQGLKPVEFS